jgi:hypothetical protein
MNQARGGMVEALKRLCGLNASLFGLRIARHAEIVFPSHPLLVLKQSALARVRLRNSDRLILVWLYRLFRSLFQATYYDRVRTHLALSKDSPLHRSAQMNGRIESVAWVGGLHHQYVPTA